MTVEEYRDDTEDSVTVDGVESPVEPVSSIHFARPVEFALSLVLPALLARSSSTEFGSPGTSRLVTCNYIPAHLILYSN